MKKKARNKPSDLPAPTSNVEYGVFFYQRNGCKVRAELSKRTDSKSAQLTAETITA
ncbi:MAG: hypothetical protein ABSB89_07425 [Candidatus Bathyarchaeia archaeon]|jgi:hypothetical protein